MARKVIIDCDPGIDDALSIMMALSSPELEVVGITVVAGNSPVQMGFENARKILKFMDRLDVPVFIGADRPMKREYINALDTHGEDGLGESYLPVVDPSEGVQTEESALSFLRRTLREGNVSIIALAPMTNLADLILEDKEAFLMTEEIISMGGNFRSHGNCSPVAEYNYWVDPDAAALVYETLAENDKMITMVGLDVTRQIVLTPTILTYMERLNPKVGTFVRKLTKFYFDFHWEWEHIIGCVINDPLAVAIFIDPSLSTGIDAYTAVETGGISIGQSVVDSMGFYKKQANAHICTQVDVSGFWHSFLPRILHVSQQDIDLIDQLL